MRSCAPGQISGFVSGDQRFGKRRSRFPSRCGSVFWPETGSMWSPARPVHPPHGTRRQGCGPVVYPPCRASNMPCTRPPELSEPYCFGGHCGLDCKSPWTNISRVKSPVRPPPARPPTAPPSDHRGTGEPGTGARGSLERGATEKPLDDPRLSSFVCDMDLQSRSGNGWITCGHVHQAK